jgi:sec-independent protein translocase protein TatB
VLAILNSLGAGEAIAILVIALIVLGPEKLPDAIRKFGNIYGELRRMSHGFQSELRDAFDEPLRELRGTAQMMQDAVNEPVQAVKAATAPVVGGGKKAAEAEDQAEAADASVDAAEAADASVEEAQAPVEETQAPVDEAPVDGETGPDQPADDGQPVLAQAGLMVSEPELAVPTSNGQIDEPATTVEPPTTADEPTADDQAPDVDEAPPGDEAVAADAPQDR